MTVDTLIILLKSYLGNRYRHKYIRIFILKQDIIILFYITTIIILLYCKKYAKQIQITRTVQSSVSIAIRHIKGFNDTIIKTDIILEAASNDYYSYVYKLKW